jgi:hypothetical protein
MTWQEGLGLFTGVVVLAGVVLFVVAAVVRWKHGRRW